MSILAADRCQSRAPSIYVADSLSEIPAIPNPKLGDVAMMVAEGAFDVWRLIESDAEPDGSEVIESNTCTYVWVKASNAGDLITPFMFGARADGSDDSIPVQLAANASAGGTLVIPSGFTFVVSQINLPSDTIVAGGGTLKYPANTSGFYLLAAEGKSNVRIGNIIFDGNVANQTTWSEFRHALWIKDSSYVTVDGVRFQNLIGDGIYISHLDSAVAPFTGSSHVIITNCFFVGTSVNRNGISMICCDDVIITSNVFVKMARFDMPGAIDIEPDQSTETIKNVIIAENTFYGHAAPTLQQGIAVNNNGADGTATGLLISNNLFDGNFRYVIAIFGNDSGTGVDEAQVLGNTIRNSVGVSLGAGIFSRDTLVTIANNKLDTVDDAGIKVLSGRCHIEGNYVIRAGEYGIHLTGTAVVTARGNTVIDAGYSSANAARGGIYLDTSNGFITDNYILSTNAAYMLQGIYSPGGTGNFLSGNSIIGSGSKNYNITGAQFWGIESTPTVGPSFDIVQERKVVLFRTAGASDNVYLQFGGTTASYAAILRDGLTLRSVLADGSAYADFYAKNFYAVNGKVNATGLVTAANNAAAIAGGLAVGDFYKTGADPDVVCVVH